MRWLRLLLLGLASVYPLYWTAQFILFFLPEALIAAWRAEPIQIVSISYLQATAIARSSAGPPAHWEALLFASLFSTLIFALRGDRFLTGAFAIVVLGQSALLPFASLAVSSRRTTATPAVGCFVALVLIVFGLQRILRRIGGVDFIDRLALLTLLAVLPQAALWLAFRFAYPFFGTRFLLLLLVPLYLGAIIAALLPIKLPESVFGSVPWTEILASSATATLLLIAITLSNHPAKLQDSQIAIRPAGWRSGFAATSTAIPIPELAGNTGGMLT